MEELDLTTREGRFRHFGSVDPIEGMKPVEKEMMVDLQSSKKDFLFEVDSVGINNLSYPVVIGDFQSVGTFELATSLRKNEKGINMSRILESLETENNAGVPLEFETLQRVLEILRARMHQEEAEMTADGKWYFSKPSPHTQLSGMAHADVKYSMRISESGVERKQLGMTAMVTTLCPCSKEISEYSAHNQRGYVKVLLDIDPEAELPEDHKEQLYEVLEINASSQLYPILKRTDEKMVTERAYENPRFVEDLIRLIAYDLVELDWVKGFELECRNEESIHQHDAFSRMSYQK
ncbi:GTP cyclohydrolase I FolE2 [Salinicoccus sp. ID82-1]|uniref:GTP cyclohydrolase FolE2 n=1 Tax=Salinicoccus cyprini TaxID=2493691 RepID=A0A558ARZ1_9STAP|nr:MULTISPECIES: GTP cyclohydrolase FolE2 [Salinicoccus]MCG1009592.1 GTP cyclohydrolase I FolE2 [Salinicoccus sp. ID82-1]TVT27024.1 GTP cyclohydrolase I FolE2 [Salinicoccus cyprini]